MDYKCRSQSVRGVVFEYFTAAPVSSTDAYEPDYTACDELIASEWAF